MNNTTQRQSEYQGDNSTASQRARLLQWLKSRPLTTLQARHSLDIMHPGMRICELRKAGHQIDMVWTKDRTPEGHLHRAGKYLLKPMRQMTLLDLLNADAEGGAE